MAELKAMSEITPKTFLVTGGAGFIGSHFVELLVKKGHRVIVLDALTYAGHPANLEQIDSSHSKEKTGEFRLIQGDICEPEHTASLLNEYQVDGVFNFAAESHVDRSIEGPFQFIQTNVVGTYHLLQESLKYWTNLPAHKKESFRLIQISTDEVFGSLGPQGKFNEKSPVEPNSPYSASKAGGDHLVRAWFHTYSLPTLITHCSNNYGARQYPEKLIPTMIQNALHKKPLPVYGDGQNIRDWIHVQDHCKGIYLTYERGALGSLYCFGGNSERTNLQVVEHLCRVLDELRPREDRTSYSTQITFVKDRLGHDRRYAVDDRLAQKELGFKQDHIFEQGLKETIQWYLDHQSWCEIVTGRNA